MLKYHKISECWILGGLSHWIFIYVTEISLNNGFRFFKKREWHKEKDDFCVSGGPGARVKVFEIERVI